VKSAAPIARSNRPPPQASYGQDPRPGDGSPIGRAVALVWRAVPTQTRADTLGWLIAWFILIAVAVQVAWIVIFNLQLGWWPAYDTHAYWLAAKHVLSGDPLYAPSLITTGGAYKYPPLFAQLIVPLGMAPELPVDWAWRICAVMCLRYMCGSWKLAVIASLLWPVMVELDFGNVTLALGAVARWSLRDRRAVYLLPWFAGMKFGPALLLPYLWFTRPEWRRTIVVSCAAFGGACLASFAVAPGLWFDYLGTFGWETSSQMSASFVYALVPNHGGTDFVLRFAIAAALTVVAIRWRLDWLAFVAAVATMPIFSLTRLAVLVALWPICLRAIVDRWRRADGSWRRWLAAPLIHLDMLPALPIEESEADPAPPAGAVSPA
jgi:hypothetical protein